MSRPTSTIDDDALYQVPLAEFTAARDALAARLKAAGDKDGAAAVKAAKKPSVPAWAANQVVWHAPGHWERLLEASRGLRRAHAESASPDALRQASREQREALLACEAKAGEQLAANGHAGGPGVLQKVGHTLLALSYEPAGVRAGRLEQDLQPPGFEALAGLTLAAPKAGPRPAAVEAPPPPPEPPEPTPAAPSGRRSEAAAKAAQRKAEEQERARRRATLAAAEARRAEARRAVVKARNRAAAEKERRATIEAQLEEARRAHDEARQQLEAAEAEDTAAEAALEALRAEFAEE